MSKETKHFLISGRVQGVGFRAFACKEALALGLKGWVRNLQDGRVEALVEGEKSLVERFEKAVTKGPRMAEVEKFNGQCVEVTNLHEFTIHRDGNTPWSKN